VPLLHGGDLDESLVPHSYWTKTGNAAQDAISREMVLAFGLDHEAFQGDPAHRALRHIAHRHAGVERREQVFLRVGEAVRAAELAGLVDVDHEAPFHLFAADAKALDLAAAARLASARHRV